VTVGDLALLSAAPLTPNVRHTMSMPPILSNKRYAEPFVFTAENLLREARRPDVLVSNIGMPDDDAYVLIRRARTLRPDEGGQLRSRRGPRTRGSRTAPAHSRLGYILTSPSRLTRWS
jgi:hypothetical protein